MQTFLPRAARHKVSMPATMRAGGPRVAVCVRDISTRGMLVESAEPPARGSYVEIIGPGNSITGRVIWAKDGRFALRTRERLDVAAPAGGRASLKLDEAADRIGRGVKPADPAHLAERSRHFALHFQFGVFAVSALLGAAVVGAVFYLKLTPVFAAILAASR